jgi:hypothetical protein
MKKYLLLVSIATVFTLSATHAQIKKGATFLGGDISGGTSKTTSADTIYAKSNGFTISPVFGKAIRENLVLGIDLNTVIYTAENPSGINYDQKNRFYGGGVFLRKYKPLGNSGFSVFAQARLGVGFERVEATWPNASTNISKTFSTRLSAYPGLSYTISKKLQLETGFNDLIALNYSSNKTTTDNTLTVNELKRTNFDVYSSLDNFASFYLGFRLLLN